MPQFTDIIGLQFQYRGLPATKEPRQVSQRLGSLCSWPNVAVLNSFGRPNWSFDRRGVIYRPIAVRSKEIAQQIVDQISRLANSMKHHPSIIHMEKISDHLPLHIGILCFTHRPRGLGLRDVLLAEAIDVILKDFEVQMPLGPEEAVEGSVTATLELERRKLLRLIQTKVKNVNKDVSAAADKSLGFTPP